VPGRNHDYRVVGGEQQRYFLKQGARDEPGADGPLAGEAALYHWAETDPKAAALRPFLPRCRHWDPERSILVLDLIAPAEAATIPPALLAGALAACHRLPITGSTLAARLSGAAPWIFEVARPVVAMLQELSPAQLALIRMLQASPDAATALDRLRERWRPSCLIHGDIKWQNVLMRLEGGLVLVDWEMAQLGEPVWDVASALHARITEAMLALELREGLGPGEAAEHLATSVAALRAEHQNFVRQYADAAGLGADEHRALVERLPSHVAARLIKTAFEWSQAEPRLPRRAAAVLQLGVNMLCRPVEGGAAVLGLQAREPASA
jgi:Phosphotransferase enzyme family